MGRRNTKLKPSLNPKTHSLWTHAKELGSFTNGQRVFFEREGNRVLTLCEDALIHGIFLGQRSIYLLAEYPNGPHFASWNSLKVSLEPS